MCFSAAGSFALSGVLTGIGAVSIARNSSKPHRLLAAVPFLFAAQQAAEGIVWLTIPDTDHVAVNRLAAVAFLGIALVVWPIWAPLSLRLIERAPSRQRALTGIAWLGGIVSATAAFSLARWQAVPGIAGHSLTYHFGRPTSGLLALLVLAAYVVPTVVPFFVSTARLARRIGGTLVVSLVIAVLIQRDALTSVWCFFAALLSVLIVIAVDRAQRAPLAPLISAVVPQV